MTKECALALAPKGISVNAVALGATYTPMNSIFDTDKKRKIRQKENTVRQNIHRRRSGGSYRCRYGQNIRLRYG